MKKKLILLTFVFLTLLGLSSCVKNHKTDSTPTEEIKYTICFDSLGGSLVSDICELEGTDISEPSSPTKLYFTFDGWYLDRKYENPYTFSKMGKENITLYAKWKPLEAAVINFDTLGGSKITSIHGTEGDQISLPENPSKLGYTFDGWYKDIDTTIPFTETVYGKEEITLYAKWAPLPNMYSITYHVGDETKEVFMTDGKVAFSNELIPDGVTLEGWYSDKVCQNKLVEGQNLTTSINAYANIYTTGLSFIGNTVSDYNGKAENVYLPSAVNGITITTIGKEAFYENKNMKTIYIADTIVNICDYAFYNAEYLVEANLSPQLSTLGDYAFYGCRRLKSITTLGNVKSIGNGAFSGCIELRDFTLSNDLESIGKFAFASCEKLTTLEFGNQLKLVDDYAFKDCKSLTTLTFNTLNNLGINVLFGCNALTSLVISNSTNYKYENGFLTNASGDTLIKYYDNGESFVLPQTIKTIKAYALEGNENITSFDVTKATNIEKGALYGMKNLSSLTVANLDKYIAYYFGADDPKDNGISNAYVCKNLEEVIVINQVDSVPDYTFFGINNLCRVSGIEHISSIGEYAFAYTGFTTYLLPNELTSIDYTSFYSAKKLTLFTEDNNENYQVSNGSIYSSNGERLLVVPTSIKDFSFNSNVKVVEKNAFNGVIIKSLVVTDSNLLFEKGALNGIVNLEYLEVPFIGDGKDNLYMQYLFGSTLTVEKKTDENNEEYDAYNFDTLDPIPATLKEITITGGVKEIGPYAFAFLTGLDKINISDQITTIGDFAFARTNFEELVIPKTVTSIGKYAYAYCYRLSKVSVASANLGEGVFANNFRLSEVTFEDGVTEIPERCFNPYSEKVDGNTNIYSSLQKVNISKTVKSIGKFAFLYAGVYGDETVYDYSLSLNFAADSELETIGLAAFENSKVVKLELPASVKVLEREAFAFCSKLENVIFGDKVNGSSIESIGELCFGNTEELKEVTIYKDVLTEEDLPELAIFVQNSAYYPFAGVNSKVSFYVPSKSVEIYRNNKAYIASGFASRIKAIEE